MNHDEFDGALITSAFELAAARGWTKVTVAEAARSAGLPLAEARRRFPGVPSILLALGRIADETALAGADDSADSTVRDRLFDIVMRRIDTFQAHRGGVLALLRALPADPLTALMLWGATLRSMGWLLDGAGISPTGLDRSVRAHGLAIVWVNVLRAWMRDEGEDLSITMAALDRSLDRAEQVAGWFGGQHAPPPADTSAMAGDPASEPMAGAMREAMSETVSASDVDLASALPRTAPPPPADETPPPPM